MALLIVLFGSLLFYRFVGAMGFSLIVAVTGLLEFAGAVGLLFPSVRLWAAWGPILLLLAIFPASVSAARRGVRIRGRPHTHVATSSDEDSFHCRGLVGPLAPPKGSEV